MKCRRHYYDNVNQMTQQLFSAGNYVNYSYDNIGQLKTAKGYESGGTARLQEQFGYAYDAAWNLQSRTNNALIQSFAVNNLNELSSGSRSGTLTVAGSASEAGANLSSVTVNGQSASIYADGSFAKSGFTVANGNNTFTAIAQDIRYIQQLLGHEKLETTAIYTEVSIRQLQEVHARCHPSATLPKLPEPPQPDVESQP